MPTPGPWVQPADTSVPLAPLWNLFRDIAALDGLETNALQDAADGVGTSLVTPNPAVTNIDTDVLGYDWWTGWVNPGVYQWVAAQTMAFWDVASVDPSVFTPVPPTPAELAQPHVVGYEYESPHGASLGSGRLLGHWRTVDAGGGNLTPAEGTVQGLAFLDPASNISPTSPPTNVWVVSSTLLGLTSQLSIPVALIDTDVYSATIAYGASPVATLVVPDEQLNLYQWSRDPQIPPIQALVGVFGTVVAKLAADYRPPRYRLLYDYIPQRQFPRDDGLGISTKRSFPRPTSKQFSQRRGPAATYL
jgi:hypothetical protein